MIEDVHFITIFSMFILSFFTTLLIRTNYISNVYDRISRQITWLDMLGAYIMVCFVTLFLHGFLDEYGDVGTIYTFPTLKMEYAARTSFSMLPSEYTFLFLPNLILGFLFCLIITYFYITVLLKLPFIDEIPYTNNSLLNDLFGLQYNVLRVFIGIAWFISTSFCIVLLITHFIPNNRIIKILVSIVIVLNSLVYSSILVQSRLIFIISLIIFDSLVSLFGLSIDRTLNVDSNIVRPSNSFFILLYLGLVYVVLGFFNNTIDRVSFENIFGHRLCNYYRRFNQSKITKYALSLEIIILSIFSGMIIYILIISQFNIYGLYNPKILLVTFSYGFIIILFQYTFGYYINYFNSSNNIENKSICVRPIDIDILKYLILIYTVPTFLSIIIIRSITVILMYVA